MKRNIFFKAIVVSLVVAVMLSLSVVVHAEEKTNLATGATFSASTYWGNEDWVSPGKMNDGDLESRWASADEDREIFVEIDFGKDTAVGEVYQVQALVNGNQITSYTVSYWDGSNWVAVATEETFEATDDEATNGKYATATFNQVTTSKLRIDYVVTWGISLNEVEVYAGQAASDDGNGNDDEENKPTESEKPENSETPGTSGNNEPPQTGDASMAVVLMTAAAAVFGGIKLRKK